MPEKSLNDVPRPLREQYEKGLAALQRNNLDYALSIFDQILQREPGFYECREALRATQFKKAGSGGGFFKRVLGTATGWRAKGQIALHSDPLESLRIAEQILMSDPNNLAAHRLLAVAALAADLPRTAVLSLEIVNKHSPGDKEDTLKLGAALTQAGEVEKAESVLSELARAHPGDNDIYLALKNASAKRTMQEGGYDALSDGSGSYRDILRNKEEAVSLEQEHKEVKSEDASERLINEYKARLVNEPANLRLMRNIAELYTQKKEFDLALQYYQQMIATEGISDPSLEKAIAETTVRKYEHELSRLDPAAPDYPEKSQQLQAQKQAFLLNECKQRADRYPSDLLIRFELGQLYFEAGKLTEAIQEFQKAQNNPHRRIQALGYLGQCFAARKIYDLAARTLQRALDEKQVFDDEKKDLVYSLGSVLEKMGKVEEAIGQFKLIYEMDIGYKDVAAKVDAYHASKGS